MSNNNRACLVDVINIHSRMVRDSLFTPYQAWCKFVHSLSCSPEEKWEKLLCWSIDPHDYSNPQVFSSDWQLFKLLSKFSVGGTPTDAEKQKGYQKFVDAERTCELHNEFVTTGSKPAFHALRHGSARIVAKTLGDVSDFFRYVESSVTERTLTRIVKSCSTRLAKKNICGPGSPVSSWVREVFEYSEVVPEFGPGVSVGEKSSKLSGPTQKLLLGTVTRDCAYLGNWISSLFDIPHCKLAEGSVLTFVVKRVGEARTICYEPSMNMVVQKLIGRYLKHRLKVVLGIDLADQSRNQSLAMLGSLCDSYATEDMSAASDLWSYQFVRDQLPLGWFKLLDDCRSKRYFDPVANEWRDFHKFSTMGNGFTFELETLLFYAVTVAAIRHFDGYNPEKAEISVYGDDIIFPKRFARTVEQALMLCGHRPNTEKSYHEGPFRESCGGDFFFGWNVTPLKIKEFNSNGRELINIYNWLAARARGDLSANSVSHRYTDAMVFIKRRLTGDHPRVSSGPSEYVVNPVGWTEYRSSDRWLDDGDTLNNVWNHNHQRIAPKYVCIQRKKQKTAYSVHPCASAYFTHFGSQVSDLEEEVVEFVRNPELRDYGKPPKRMKIELDLTPIPDFIVERRWTRGGMDNRPYGLTITYASGLSERR